MKKRIIAILVSLSIMISGLFGIYIFIEARAENWYVKTSAYNLFNLDIAGSYGYTSSEDESGNFTVTSDISGVNAAGMPWYPTIQLTSTSKLGFSAEPQRSYIDFKLNNTTFGNFNGYNGAVSIAWFNGNAPDTDRDYLMAENLHFTNYDINTVNHFDYFYKMGGGLAPQIAKKSQGLAVVLTLYPDNSGTNNSRATHCRLFVKKCLNACTDTDNSIVYNSEFEIYDWDFVPGLDLSVLTRIELDKVTLVSGQRAIALRYAQLIPGGNTSLRREDMNVMVFHKLSREKIIEDENTGAYHYNVSQSSFDNYSVLLPDDISDYYDRCNVSISVTGAWNSQPSLTVYECR